RGSKAVSSTLLQLVIQTSRTVVVRIEVIDLGAVGEAPHLNGIAVFVRRRHDELNVLDEGDAEFLSQRLDVVPYSLLELFERYGAERLVVDFYDRIGFLMIVFPHERASNIASRNTQIFKYQNSYISILQS